MRLVAAARVRRAQEAVLKTRPLIGQLQMVFKTVLEACKNEVHHEIWTNQIWFPLNENPKSFFKTNRTWSFPSWKFVMWRKWRLCWSRVIVVSAVVTILKVISTVSSLSSYHHSIIIHILPYITQTKLLIIIYRQPISINQQSVRLFVCLSACPSVHLSVRSDQTGTKTREQVEGTRHRFPIRPCRPKGWTMVHSSTCSHRCYFRYVYNTVIILLFLIF